MRLSLARSVAAGLRPRAREAPLLLVWTADMPPEVPALLPRAPAAPASPAAVLPRLPWQSLVELGRARAATLGDQPLYTFLPERGGEDVAQLSYAGLDLRARAIAAAPHG